MNSHAAWTPSPSTERQIAEERRSASVKRRLGWTLSLVALGGCPFSCVGCTGMGNFDPLGSGLLVLWTVVVVSLGFAYLRRSAQARELRKARTASLLSGYGDVSGWFVDMVVYQGDAPTGRDRGVVWFEDDRLYFSGERTSFGVTAAQARSGQRGEWGGVTLRSSIMVGLETQTKVGRLTIGLDLLQASDGAWPYSPQGSLSGAIRGWLGSGAPSSEGQPPPLDIGPDAPTSASLLGRALMLVGCQIFLASAVFLFGLNAGWNAALCTGLIGSIVLMLWPDFWTPRLHWRAYRDRRRLELSLRQDNHQ